LHLYAFRRATKGYAFSPDDPLQREFEDSFEFQETPHQQSAIEDVKEDMESEKPMDRLICGDVGYGKTEVAMRAAFKAVNEGKQVAVLVPTTVLAQQHYNTGSEGRAARQANVELLSNSRSRPGAEKSVEGHRGGAGDTGMR